MVRRRNCRLRWKRVRQDSPFLRLPGEIRTMIYRAALISPKPIDLWPNKYVEKPENNPAIAWRISKLRKEGKISDTDIPTFRQQDDLQYVRKEMATGLLATCRRVNQEAALLFWQANTFRFSGDVDWLGLRRFLATIGPRAIGRMKSLEVFIPLNEIPAKNDANRDAENEEYGRCCEAKNSPTLHTAKVFLKDRPWWVNMTDACLFLADADCSLNLRYIVPQGFILLQSNMHPDCWLLKNLEDFQTRAPGASMSVIIEPGAILEGVDTLEILASSGLDVFCMPGSFRERNNIITQNLEIQSFTDKEYEYLGGVALLFRDKEKTAVPALGGRVTKSPGFRMNRVLKGFGGCRFTRGFGYVCEWCGKLNAEEKCDFASSYFKHLTCRGCHSRREHTKEEVMLTNERETDWCEGVEAGGGSGEE